MNWESTSPAEYREPVMSIFFMRGWIARNCVANALALLIERLSKGKDFK